MTEFADKIGAHALRMLAPAVRKLPLETALALGRFAGQCAFFISGRRRVAYADLKAALGNTFDEKQRWKILREHYEHLGMMFMEVLRFPSLDRAAVDRLVVMDHPERFFDAANGEKGVVFMAAHFGNWELLQIVSGILGKPVHVLARNQKYPRLNAFLNELRESHGSTAVRRGMGMRDLLRGLAPKELIGMLGDQDAVRTEGLILPFFGRKTTVPTGGFELAMRTGATLLPCFMVREKGPYHRFCVGEPVACAPGELETCVRNYLKVLEDFIRRFPSHWLWEAKRWKYTWTKRLLILSDGKPGHVKQSEALARQFQNLKEQYGRPGMEYPTQTLEVRFRSKRRQMLFSWFALFFIPWAQGRLRWLKFFFTPETHQALCEASADFVISAGASLAPLNLCLARDSRAKSVVLMKPNFPFNFFRYDLAVIPAHDRGFIPDRVFRTRLAPGEIDPDKLEEAGRRLKKNLRAPDRVKWGIFLGGPTRHFKMAAGDVEKLFSHVKRISRETGDYLVTTSRRTPDAVSRLLKEKVAGDPSCQMLVIAKEDPRPEVAGGMMALAEVLVVTEDSISMISEAVLSGKKVVVLNSGADGLPAKHRRFKEILEREAMVVTANTEDLEEKMMRVIRQNGRGRSPAREESAALQEMLRAIL